jgi:hypothetical protein
MWSDSPLWRLFVEAISSVIAVPCCQSLAAAQG